jgi:hypothetical protein
LKIAEKNFAPAMHFAVAAPYCETGPEFIGGDFGGLGAVE